MLSALTIHCAQLQIGLLSTTEKQLSRDFHADVLLHLLRVENGLKK